MRPRLPGRGDVQGNIDLLFKDMGEKSEAKQMFIEAAGIRRKVFGADHPLTKKSAIGCTNKLFF